MKNGFILLSLVLVSLRGFAASPVLVSPLTVREVRALGYFDRLDYSDARTLAGAPELEASLMESADLAYAMPSTDPYLKENALIFIYAALLMDNSLEAYRAGKFPTLRWTDEEIRTRTAKILAYVERAKELLPEDIRMDSWVLGMKVKHLNVDYADEIVRIADERRDTFSLISALTVTRDLPLSEKQRGILEKLVKRFASLKTPCFSKKTGHQCRSTPLAPFAAQTGVMMLADYRVRMAEREESARGRIIGRYMARKLYRSMTMKLAWMKDSTPFWRNEPLISERISLTRGKGFSSDRLEAFRSSDRARAIYQCSSCHASPVKPVDSGT